MCYQYIRGYQIYQNNKLHNNSFRLHYVNTHFLTMKICKLYLFYHLSGTVVFINFKHLIVLCQQLFDKLSTKYLFIFLLRHLASGFLDISFFFIRLIASP